MDSRRKATQLTPISDGTSFLSRDEHREYIIQAAKARYHALQERRKKNKGKSIAPPKIVDQSTESKNIPTTNITSSAAPIDVRGNENWELQAIQSSLNAMQEKFGLLLPLLKEFHGFDRTNLSLDQLFINYDDIYYIFETYLDEFKIFKYSDIEVQFNDTQPSDVESYYFFMNLGTVTYNRDIVKFNCKLSLDGFRYKFSLVFGKVKGKTITFFTECTLSSNHGKLVATLTPGTIATSEGYNFKDLDPMFCIISHKLLVGFNNFDLYLDYKAALCALYFALSQSAKFGSYIKQKFGNNDKSLNVIYELAVLDIKWRFEKYTIDIDLVVFGKVMTYEWKALLPLYLPPNWIQTVYSAPFIFKNNDIKDRLNQILSSENFVWIFDHHSRNPLLFHYKMFCVFQFTQSDLYDVTYQLSDISGKGFPLKKYKPSQTLLNKHRIKADLNDKFSCFIVEYPAVGEREPLTILISSHKMFVTKDHLFQPSGFVPGPVDSISICISQSYLPKEKAYCFLDIMLHNPQLSLVSRKRDCSVQCLGNIIVKCERGNDLVEKYESKVPIHEFGSLKVVRLTSHDGNEVPVLSFQLKIPLTAIFGSGVYSLLEFVKIKFHSVMNVNRLQLTSESGLSEWIEYHQTKISKVSFERYLMINQHLYRNFSIDFSGLQITEQPEYDALLYANRFHSVVYQFNLEVYSQNAIINQIIKELNALSEKVDILDHRVVEFGRMIGLLVNKLNGLDLTISYLKDKFEKYESKATGAPWYIKVLEYISIIGGIVSPILMPISMIGGIGMLLVGSTHSIAQAFLNDDIGVGSVYIIGLVLGIGSGYFTSRRIAHQAYPSVKLQTLKREADAGIPDNLKHLLNEDGMFLETRPLTAFGPTVEKLGSFISQKLPALDDFLLKVDNSPTHARFRSVSTFSAGDKIMRKNVISGVTDGMPFLGNLNSRPGVFTTMEEFDLKSQTFKPGWNKDNVPKVDDFNKLPLGVRGLVLEGMTHPESYATLMSTWPNASLDERAMFLNEHQVTALSGERGRGYMIKPKTKIPGLYDHEVIENVVEVFAKHSGLYELTGLTSKHGPNNCQTYGKEILKFFKRGALEYPKLHNSTFTNDLMLSIAKSREFDTIYRPGLDHK